MENITQGDWQTPGEQVPKKSKFIFIIVITVVVLAVAVVAFLAVQYKKQSEVVETPVKKVYTIEEKMEILKELSAARATSSQQAGTPGSLLKADGTAKPTTQVTKERLQILQSISATVPRSTLSDEEKLKVLNSLSR